LETILIVDEDRHSAEAISQTILPELGYQSVVAASGEAALRAIKRDGLDICLLILEWELPDLSGEELLREIRNLGVVAPTIAIMDENFQDISVAAMQLGLEQVVYKPIDAKRLVETLEQILEKKHLRSQNMVLKKRLKDQYIWTDEITSTGRYIASSIDLDQIVLRVVEVGIRLTNAHQASIALSNQDDGKITLKAYKNKNDKEPSLVDTEINSSFIDRVFSEAKPCRVSKEQASQSITDVIGLQVDSVVHVPICDRDNVLGVISASCVDGENLSTKDEAILSSIADYAAVALKNAWKHQVTRDEVYGRLAHERNLELDQERHHLAARAAQVGIWDWDFKTNMTYFSMEWKSIMGYDDQEIGHKVHEWFDRVHPSDAERVKLELSACALNPNENRFESEYRFLHKDGSYRWLLNQATVLRNTESDVHRLTGIHIDITDRKQFEESLLYNAYHDVLTGLLNRSLFINRLEHTIQRYRRKRQSIFAVLSIELRNFDKLSKEPGRFVSDRLLLLVGDLLKKRLRSNDTLAHFGNGQFAILLEELRDEVNISRVTREILEIFKNPFVLDGNAIQITASCGILFDLSGYERAEDVQRDVEIAMSSARAAEKTNLEIFSPQLRDHLLGNIESGIDIKNAIDNDELEVYYQPIIGFEQGEIVGFEALVRWTHPERGIITPDKFIHIAEENGLIIDIDRWVLQNTCYQIKEWQQKSIASSSISVSVNISAELINEKGFLNYVEATLKESQLQPSSLKLEITERSMLPDNDRTIELLSKLLSLGVHVDIDDFGIGYSSLGYLSHFPLGGLKIDRSFVRGITNNDRQREIVNAIVSLTSRLNVNVVAEGVETQEQMDYLKTIGCQFGQGFLIAEPLRSNDVPIFLSVYLAQLQHKHSLNKTGESAKNIK
jgi:diguanylate cyclase (GGDEF)-like protein/PAS domain S-box-containing protein